MPRQTFVEYLLPPGPRGEPRAQNNRRPLQRAPLDASDNLDLAVVGALPPGAIGYRVMECDAVPRGDGWQIRRVYGYGPAHYVGQPEHNAAHIHAAQQRQQLSVRTPAQQPEPLRTLVHDVLCWLGPADHVIPLRTYHRAFPGAAAA